MSKTAIILHGTMGSPEGNWFMWLRGELEQIGFTVWLPQLPHAEKPSTREWVDFVKTNCPFEIDENTLIVGHSSGAICATVLAQELSSFGRVIGVSIFHNNDINWEPLDKLFDVEFDFVKLKTVNKKLLFIHSDNDPYVPLSQAEFIANNSGAKLRIIPGQGHFNLEVSEKYKKFPKLLEEILQASP